jgi:hypothetical protein
LLSSACAVAFQAAYVARGAHQQRPLFTAKHKALKSGSGFCFTEQCFPYFDEFFPAYLSLKKRRKSLPKSSVYLQNMGKHLILSCFEESSIMINHGAVDDFTLLVSFKRICWIFFAKFRKCNGYLDC